MVRVSFFFLCQKKRRRSNRKFRKSLVYTDIFCTLITITKTLFDHREVCLGRMSLANKTLYLLLSDGYANLEYPYVCTIAICIRNKLLTTYNIYFNYYYIFLLFLGSTGIVSCSPNPCLHGGACYMKRTGEYACK